MENVFRGFPPLCWFSRQSGRSCCPDCSACSGVVVEGRVNEEEDVLVVHGK